MEKYIVASSNIASLGYDPDTETLEVEFLNGSIYQYFNVQQNIFDQLYQASSKGRFLNTYIKNVYPFSRIG